MAERNDTETSRRTGAGTAETPDARDEIVESWARSYGEKLRRFFVRRGLGAAEADDMTQEVYVRIARMNNVNTIREPAAFLFQTAANLLRDHARRAQARQMHRHVDVEECHLTTEVSAPDRVLESKQSLEGVLRVLRTLTERQRTVFVLHRFEGMTYGQIASHLDISTSAVEKHMMKAIARVHQYLEDW